MKTKMKNPQKTQKPLKLSKGLNPKSPTSANPVYIYIYIYIYIYMCVYYKSLLINAMLNYNLYIFIIINFLKIILFYQQSNFKTLEN